MTITTSAFVVDLGTTVLKVFRTSFVNESNVLIRLNNESSFKPSFPSNWAELAAISRQSFIDNYPMHSARLLLVLDSFQFSNLNSNYLGYAIPKYQFGSLTLGVSYDNQVNICIFEALVNRQYSFPFELRSFNFDPQADIHNLNFICLQLRSPMSGTFDLNTIFNPPSF